MVHFVCPDSRLLHAGRARTWSRTRPPSRTAPRWSPRCSTHVDAHVWHCCTAHRRYLGRISMAHKRHVRGLWNSHCCAHPRVLCICANAPCARYRFWFWTLHCIRNHHGRRWTDAHWHMHSAVGTRCNKRGCIRTCCCTISTRCCARSCCSRRHHNRRWTTCKFFGSNSQSWMAHPWLDHGCSISERRTTGS